MFYSVKDSRRRGILRGNPISFPIGGPGTACATKARPKYDFVAEFCARISVCGQK